MTDNIGELIERLEQGGIPNWTGKEAAQALKALQARTEKAEGEVEQLTSPLADTALLAVMTDDYLLWLTDIQGVKLGAWKSLRALAQKVRAATGTGA